MARGPGTGCATEHDAETTSKLVGISMLLHPLCRCQTLLARSLFSGAGSAKTQARAPGGRGEGSVCIPVLHAGHLVRGQAHGTGLQDLLSTAGCTRSSPCSSAFWEDLERKAGSAPSAAPASGGLLRTSRVQTTEACMSSGAVCFRFWSCQSKARCRRRIRCLTSRCRPTR